MSNSRKERTRDVIGDAIECGMVWGLTPEQFIAIYEEEWTVRRFDRTKRENAQWSHALRPETLPEAT